MKKIPYNNELVKSSYTYSIDGIVLLFTIDHHLMESITEGGFEPFRQSPNKRVEKENPKSYRYQYIVNYSIGKIYLNIGKYDNNGSYLCYLKCNPNKCFNDKQCLADIKEMLSLCLSYWIKSIDIAIDIPVKYNDISVRKDRRYQTTSGSSAKNQTVYLGKKRGIGRVKVYNKAAESKLTNDITRVELTLANPLKEDWYESLLNKLPTIFVYTCGNDVYLLDNLSSTDQVLIKLFRESYQKNLLFKQLDYKKRKKLEKYIFTEKEKLTFDPKTIQLLALKIFDYFAPENFIVAGTKYISGDILSRL